MSVLYSYAEGNLIENPHTYQYSHYHGMPFLLAWLKQREAVKAELGKPEPPPKTAGSYPFKINQKISTQVLLDNLYEGFVNKLFQQDDELKRCLKLILKNFEITKKVYTAYDAQLKPLDKDDYRPITHYLRLAEIMVVAYTNDRDLTYLNTLLKLVDILVAHQAELNKKQASRLSWIIEQEVKHVTIKAKGCGVYL